MNFNLANGLFGNFLFLFFSCLITFIVQKFFQFPSLYLSDAVLSFISVYLCVNVLLLYSLVFSSSDREYDFGYKDKTRIASSKSNTGRLDSATRITSAVKLGSNRLDSASKKASSNVKKVFSKKFMNPGKTETGDLIKEKEEDNYEGKTNKNFLQRKYDKFSTVK